MFVIYNKNSLAVSRDKNIGTMDSAIRPCVVKLKRIKLPNETTKPENFVLTIKLKGNPFKIAQVRDSRNKAAKQLETGWSSTVSKLIWQHFRLKCVWSFKRGRPRQNDIIMTGNCKDCGAHITATYDIVQLNLTVDVQGYNQTIKHTAKRRLLQGESKQIEDLMEKHTAFELRSKLADEHIEVGDEEPPYLISANAMRKIKQRKNQSTQKCPVKAIELMKQKEFRNSIQNIGYDPFFAFYSSELQKMWYHSEFSNKRCVVSIDATGLGLKKLGNVDEKYMFLYVICGQGKKDFNYFKLKIHYRWFQ